MSEFIPDERASRTCLKCAKPMNDLTIVRGPGGVDGAMHECGTVYTREFMRVHFGIEWTP